jgi:hypothetical protein
MPTPNPIAATPTDRTWMSVRRAVASAPMSDPTLVAE